MTTPAAYRKVERLPLRGVRRAALRPDAEVTPAQLPQRPNSRVLSESIPLFFIGRNKIRLWVAREAEGRCGGIFLFKRSALRFARSNSAPSGCATMVVRQPLELDIANRGNAFAERLDAVLRRIGRFIPEYPPPIPIRRKAFIGERP